jgi:tetratricopeptide (TPR) repeat protein
MQQQTDQLRIISAEWNGQSYPIPSLGELESEPEAFVKEMERSPEVRERYRRAMEAWGLVVHKMKDLLLQQDRADVVIEVLGYFRTHPIRDVRLQSEMMLSLAQCEKHESRQAAAVAILHEVVAQGLAKDDPRPWHYAGWSLFEMGRCEDARRNYQRAIELWEEAARSYKGRREPYSGYAKAYLNLWLLYADSRCRDIENRPSQSVLDGYLRRALELARQAEANEGHVNPRVSFTLAVTFAYLGNAHLALRYAQQAMQMDRTYSVIAERDPAFQRLPKTARDRLDKLASSYRPGWDEPGITLTRKFDPSYLVE